MHNVHNEKNNYTADLNGVSAERTGVLSATFRFQAWPHMVLESEVILDLKVHPQGERTLVISNNHLSS